MTLRKQINGGIRQLTGYELKRAGTVPAQRKKTAANKAAAVKAAAPKPAAKPAPKPAPKPGLKFPHDYDDLAKETIRSVKPFTMTSPEKLNALIYATRYVVKNQIPGDIVECGVWRGGSMMAVARTLAESGDTSRDLYLFDTYEGMSEPTDKDKRHDGKSAAEMLANSARTSGVWAVAGLDDVKAQMESVTYPAERVHYVQGMVEETVPREAPEQISILRLDTDWYASTKHELEQLFPRLVPGGVLIIDDYGWWQGSRDATEEFINESGVPLLLLRIDEGRIAVKVK